MQVSNVILKAVRSTPRGKAILIAISSIILCSMAYYNTFPYVYNTDTAAYMEAAYTGKAGDDRPILYGLFIFLTSANYSLWLVIFSQAILVSYSLLVVFKTFVSKSSLQWMANTYGLFFLSYVVFVSFLMSASFQVSWLMPDVFTAISFLCLISILFLKDIKSFDFIASALIWVLSLAMHNSNSYICLLVLTLILFMLAILRFRKRSQPFHPGRVFLAISLIVLSNLFLASIHYIYGKSFKGTRGGIVFFMGNLVDMKVIKPYLDENCGSKNYQFCKYKDNISPNFLWDEKSPLYKTGGWIKNEDEYKEIIKDILTTPKYLREVVAKSLLLSLKQFFLFETGEAPVPWNKVHGVMFRFHKNETDFLKYYNARQNQGTLDFNLINFAQRVIVATLLMVYGYMIIRKKGTPATRILICFVLLSLLVNASFCATFSGAFPRYQSRVIWLLPLPLFIFFIERCDRMIIPLPTMNEDGI